MNAENLIVPGDPMPYTIWSNQQLLGETDLEWRLPGGPSVAGGLFRPTTEHGNAALPVFREFFRAFLWIDEFAEAHGLESPPAPAAELSDDQLHHFLAPFRETEEGRSAAAIVERYIGLRLEIRDDLGSRVPVEQVCLGGPDAFCNVAEHDRDRLFLSFVDLRHPRTGASVVNS